MALYGSSVPLDGGGFAVTVVCPNAYCHTRLMQLLNTIVPEAADVESIAVSAPPPAPPEVVAEEVPADDDEGDAAEPARYPPGTACNITGECE